MLDKIRLFTLLTLLFLAQSVDPVNETKLLWPLPTRVSVNPDADPFSFDISDISFRISAFPPDAVEQALNIYLINVFKCSDEVVRKIKSQMKFQQHQQSWISSSQNIVFNIVVRNATQMVSFETSHEKYQLTIRENTQWELIADYYVGFLRGFQTFSQLLEDNSKNRQYIINGRPILIDDEPQFKWRGLMIDTARHYLPFSSIQHIIDGLMFSKMNVLHWHIVDQESFPLQIPNRPELEDYGRVGGTYTLSQVKSIIQYAKIRGIRVVPEFDSPAHTRSWTRSPSLSEIGIPCGYQFQGQFDPTFKQTYQLISDVMKVAAESFIDPYIHLGGDEADLQCWQKENIKKFMNEHNITSLESLEIYYRERQRQLLREISKNKKAIYWANEEINLPVQENDVIQWWGESQNIQQLKKWKNPIILSYYDYAYLDTGFGDELGEHYRNYINWRDLYHFQPRVEGMNILGGEACMWSELTCKDNIDQKLWPRTAILAERLWNSSPKINSNLLNIAERLISHQKRLKARGFKPEPVTVGLCEKNPEICFS